MDRELELDESPTGQWRYRILTAYVGTVGNVSKPAEEQRVLVDWQWGPYDKNECIEQARSRFSFERIGWVKFHRDSMRTRAY